MPKKASVISVRNVQSIILKITRPLSICSVRSIRTLTRNTSAAQRPQCVVLLILILILSVLIFICILMVINAYQCFGKTPRGRYWYFCAIHAPI